MTSDSPGSSPQRGPGGRWWGQATAVVEWSPAPGAFRVALRASTSVLAAMLVLWSVDRLDWTLYATFGAFSSVYGGGSPTARRWRLQAASGVVLVCAVLSGALIGLSPHREWLSIAAAAGWAALAAWLSDQLTLRPPGPLFPVFAVASCAAVQTRAADVLPAAAVAAGTAAVAVAFGALEAWTAHRRLPLREPPHAPGLPLRPRVQAIRCAATVLVTGTIATASGIGHPYWAMVAGVAPMSTFTLAAQVTRGVHRAVGTLLGLVLAAGLLRLSLPTLWVLVVVAGLQGATELLVARNYGAALIFVTPLALLLGQLANPQPVSALLQDRLLETVIGVAVGVTVVVVTRRRD